MVADVAAELHALEGYLCKVGIGLVQGGLQVGCCGGDGEDAASGGDKLAVFDGGAGVKDDYDRFYSWTSIYSHGHWAAIRATVFDTCGNPLHRFHRIPRSTVRSQGDVLADSVVLVDKLLELVDRAYPTFASRAAVEGE